MVMVTRKDDGEIIIIKQSRKENLTQPVNQKTFSIQLSLDQYVVVCIKPDVCSNIQRIAPGMDEASPQEFNALFNTIGHLSKTR